MLGNWGARLLVSSIGCAIATGASAGCLSYQGGAWVNYCPTAVYGHYTVIRGQCGVNVGWTGDFGPIRAGQRSAAPHLNGCGLQFRWCDYQAFTKGTCSPYH